MRARLLLLALLGVALSLAAPAARADEPAPAAGAAPAAASALTAGETEFLRRRFPDWDQKDAVERERIAANVVRLRSLSPAERDRLLERVRRAERAGLVGTGQLTERVGWWREHGAEGRGRALQGHAVRRAISSIVLAALPEETRRALRGPGAGLSPLHRGAVESAIVTAWWERATQPFAASPPLDAAPSEGAPPREAADLARLRGEVEKRGGAAAPVELRRAFAAALARDRVGAALRTAHGPGGGKTPPPAPGAPPPAPATPPPTREEREAAVERLAVALRAAFPGAHEAVAADLARAAGNGPEAVVAWAWQQERGSRMSPAARRRRLLQIADTLERDEALRSPEALRGSGDVQRRAEELQTAIFQELGVPEADQQRLREARSPFERLRAWTEIRRRLGGRR